MQCSPCLCCLLRSPRLAGIMQSTTVQNTTRSSMLFQDILKDLNVKGTALKELPMESRNSMHYAHVTACDNMRLHVREQSFRALFKMQMHLTIPSFVLSCASDSHFNDLCCKRCLKNGCITRLCFKVISFALRLYIIQTLIS